MDRIANGNRARAACSLGSRLPRGVGVGAVLLMAACGGDPAGGGGGQAGGTAGGQCPAGPAASQCAWPSGVAFGRTEGKTVASGLSWLGFTERCSEVTTVPIERFYDCDGTRGINALYVSTSRYNCGGCAAESAELQGKLSGGWLDAGIRVLMLVINNPQDGPPTVDDALNYKQGYGLEDVSIVSDPALTFVATTTITTPLVALVDPRTMQIVRVSAGYPGPYAELEALAQQNAGP